AAAGAARVADLPLSDPDQMLVLASIVEKETGRADERARIAGVFTRRLKIGMRLQTDPTVIYGVGTAFDGNLTRVHLATDTPYNTYTRGGLPPTPIAAPGRDALRAVARPDEGQALFFVARGDGSHEFSATLAQHNAAVARWQLRRR
ncbi:MAG: endolytic transglycosylase MltG, partial [Pseudomonadota bacterium]